jgi:hypothetical protein
MSDDKDIAAQLVELGVKFTGEGRAIVRDIGSNRLITLPPDQAYDKLVMKEVVPEGDESRHDRRISTAKSNAAKDWGPTGAAGLKAVSFAVPGGGAALDALGVASGQEQGEAFEEFPKSSAAGAGVGLTLNLLSPLKGVGTVGKILPGQWLARGAANLTKKVGGVKGMMAGTAAELSVFNAGQAVDEFVIENPDYTAEELVGQGLKGAAIGGGAGLAFGAVGAGLLKVGGKIAARGRKPIIDLAGPEAAGFRDAMRTHLGVIEEAGQRANYAGAGGLEKIMAREGQRKAAAGISQADFLNSVGAKNLDEFVASYQKIDDIGVLVEKTGAYANYIRAGEAALKQAGDDATVKLLAEADKQVTKQFNEVAKAAGFSAKKFRAADVLAVAIDGAELTDAMAGTDFVNLPAPVEAALGLWATGRLARRGPGLLSKLTGKAAPQAAGAVSARVAEQVARNTGLTGVKGAALRGFSNFTARKGAAHVVDNSIAGVLNSTRNSQGRLARAAGGLTKASGRNMKGSFAKSHFAAARGIMKTLDKYAESDKPQTFKQRVATLNTINGNPQALATFATGISEQIVASSPVVAEKTKVGVMKAVNYMTSKAPRDPHLVSFYGAGDWDPSVEEEDKFMALVNYVADPDSAFEDLAIGQLTPDGAEVIKELYPAKFARFQQELMNNPEKLKNMEYGRCIQYGMLFEVETHPMIPLISPLQETYAVAEEEKAQREAQAKKGTTAMTSTQEPTLAQSMTENR